MTNFPVGRRPGPLSQTAQAAISSGVPAYQRSLANACARASSLDHWPDRASRRDNSRANALP